LRDDTAACSSYLIGGVYAEKQANIAGIMGEY